MNIALLSPSRNLYSETFIQAHKKLLKGKVFFYYGEKSNIRLEGEGPLFKTLSFLLFKIKGKIIEKSYEYPFQQILKKSFKVNKIDVVLAEYGPTAHDHLNAVKSLQLPLIVHFHGYDASRKDILKHYENYKEVFHYATFVVAVSKKMVNDIINLGCPEHKVIYSVCGPNDLFLNVLPQYNKKQFVAIGRFVDKKAPYYVILAFAQVLQIFPEANLVMAGNGNLLEVCKNLVTYLNIEKSVEFAGIIDPQQFSIFLKNSIALVQHSITANNGNSEGTPVSILEASAAGLPVISTRHAGIPDVIIDGKTGLLVSEHDVDGMAENMITLLANLDLAKEMGRQGKENITNNFTIQKHISILDNIIEQAVRLKFHTSH